MKKITLAFLLFCAFNTYMFAQQLTLKQCVDYALENNSNAKIAEYDAKISELKVKQQVGTGLPQIDGSVSIKNNMDIATTTLGGQSIKMGTRYTTSGGLSLTQKIFDPLFWVGLKAAKLSDQYSAQTIQQTKETIAYSVGTLYYTAVIQRKQLNNYKASFEASAKNLASSKVKFENGAATQTEYDRIKVDYNNSKTQLQQAELNFIYSLNALKLAIGMPVRDSIIVIDEVINENPESAETLLQNENYLENRIDYQLLQTNLQLMEANKQQYISNMLPSISLSAYYGYQQMDQKFNAFQSGSNWYKSSYVQLDLKVPIFSGFSKLSQVSQAQIDIDISKEQIKYREQSIENDISNYTTNYLNAFSSLQSEKENVELAQKVYNNTQQQYQQGISSANDLTSAESSLLTAQSNYLNKLLSLYSSRLDLEKAKGSLMNFINNQK